MKDTWQNFLKQGQLWRQATEKNHLLTKCCNSARQNSNVTQCWIWTPPPLWNQIHQCQHFRYWHRSEQSRSPFKHKQCFVSHLFLLHLHTSWTNSGSSDRGNVTPLNDKLLLFMSPSLVDWGAGLMAHWRHIQTAACKLTLFAWRRQNNVTLCLAVFTQSSCPPPLNWIHHY